MTEFKVDKEHQSLSATLTSDGVQIEMDAPWANDGRGEWVAMTLSPDEARQLGNFLSNQAGASQDAATASLFDVAMEAAE